MGKQTVRHHILETMLNQPRARSSQLFMTVLLMAIDVGNTAEGKLDTEKMFNVYKGSRQNTKLEQRTIIGKRYKNRFFMQICKQYRHQTAI